MIATNQQSDVSLLENERKATIVRAALGAEGKCLLLVFALEGAGGKIANDTIWLSPHLQLDRLGSLSYAVGIPDTGDGPTTDPTEFLGKRVVIAFDDSGGVVAYFRPQHQLVLAPRWNNFQDN
jgi:hypothetical protein